jgi:nicotinamide-nucleotide amidase
MAKKDSCNIRALMGGKSTWQKVCIIDTRQIEWYNENHTKGHSIRPALTAKKERPLSRFYDISAKLGEELKKIQATVTTVESLTGGGIAHAITAVPGSSEWLEVSYVTYSNKHKALLAGVSSELLESKGPVCREVAIEMALGGMNRAGSTYAIAVTGIAGPQGGTPENPVGTVWIAWATPWTVMATRKQYPVTDRGHIRDLTIEDALHGLHDILTIPGFTTE